MANLASIFGGVQTDGSGSFDDVEVERIAKENREDGDGLKMKKAPTKQTKGAKTKARKEKIEERASVQRERSETSSSIYRSEIDELLTPEAMEFLVLGPADYRFGTTGRSWWESKPDVREKVCRSVATAAKHHVGEMSVKWLSTALAITNVAGFYLTRIVQDIIHARSTEQDKQLAHEKKMAEMGNKNGS
jgi:hypothetical protein